MQIFGFLGSLLGYVLWGAFYLLKDFGLSIIVFTIIVRLCMFPFTIKQQKSMAGTARLSKNKRKFRKNIKITDKRHRKKYISSMKRGRKADRRLSYDDCSVPCSFRSILRCCISAYKHTSYRQRKGNRSS